MKRILSALMSAVLIMVLTVVGITMSASATYAAGSCAAPVAQTQPAGKTTINSIPDKWAMTDGNVLVATMMYLPTGPAVAIGGNFTQVIQKNGVIKAARNLAVINLATGMVNWSASSMTGYPRAIEARNGVMYLGGSFTQINGVARKTIASMNPYTGAMNPWYPTIADVTVRAIQVTDTAVYVGTNGFVDSFNINTAAKNWETRTSKGVVRALLLSPDHSGLYVGGTFNDIGGSGKNQLAEIYPITTGKIYAPFAPLLKRNSYIGTKGDYDGEVVGRLEWDFSDPNRLGLLLGDGGAMLNAVRDISPYNGVGYWGYATEGDTQGLTQLGNTIVSGYHRNHDNLLGCPYPYYTTQWSSDNGTILPWDSRLSGRDTSQSLASGGNGGVGDIAVDTQSKKIVFVGDFSFWNQTCNISVSLICTGGTKQRGLAVYGWN